MSKAMDCLRAGALLMALVEQQRPPLPTAHFGGNQYEGLKVGFHALAEKPTEHETPLAMRERLSAFLGAPDENDTRDGTPYDPMKHRDSYERLYATHTWHWSEITVQLHTYRAWWEAQK